MVLTKRADDCEEIPEAAVVRKAKKETILDVEVEREIGVRAFKFELDGEDGFKLFG